MFAARSPLSTHRYLHISTLPRALVAQEQDRRAEKRSAFRRMQVRAIIHICPSIATIAFPVDGTQSQPVDRSYRSFAGRRAASPRPASVSEHPCGGRRYAFSPYSNEDV